MKKERTATIKDTIGSRSKVTTNWFGKTQTMTVNRFFKNLQKKLFPKKEIEFDQAELARQTLGLKNTGELLTEILERLQINRHGNQLILHIPYGTPERLNSLTTGLSMSITIIFAQCIELLLKWKLQEERRLIPTTHNLHVLYSQLNRKTQTTLEEEFQEKTKNMEYPEGFDTLNSTLKKWANILVDWRYCAEVEKGYLKAITTCPQFLDIIISIIRQNTDLPNVPTSPDDITYSDTKEEWERFMDTTPAPKK